MAPSVPSATVRGSPTPSSRAYRAASRRSMLIFTVDASANSTHTKVVSATNFTGSPPTCRTSRPAASSQPTATNTIGADR